MKYLYEDLSEDQFECLIVLICKRLFGISVQGFAKGVDGGRDAKFHGTAELYPSKAAPWDGITIIQAKHTIGHNRSFSESDFFSANSTNCIVGKEVPRIKKLRANQLLDHYMLFANRRLTGNAESEIRTYIAQECNMHESSVSLCGIEQLESWLRVFPDVPMQADLDPIDSPLIISSDALAEVVEALARQVKSTTLVVDDPPTPRVTYEQKNLLNNMTEAYAKEQRKKYLKDTAQIRAFLAAPENLELMHKYEAIVDEFQLEIIANRKDYQTFDKVMNYMAKLLFERDPVLCQHRHKRLTRAVLFYMYWHCDIGEVTDAETD